VDEYDTPEKDGHDLNSSIAIKSLSSFVAGPTHRFGALPPNKGMQLTIKSVTPFCKSKGRATFACN
jgi:hypothetical protein